MSSIRRKLGFVLALCLMLPLYATAQQRQPDVVFVPTDPLVVDAMLRMSGVSKNDVVYDLGCGDGRLVIAAAKEYGARGVGIDIDPQRIKESRENAAKAGVANRVKFVVGDLFEADFHEASVVMLYLLPELNVKLRPILLRQLKPGTPVVSHDFDMGDWEADEVKTVTGATRDHTVYKWIVPANIAGVWQLNAVRNPATATYRLKIEQKYQKVSGTLTSDSREIPLTDLSLEGDSLSFTMPETGEHFIGRLKAGVIEGSAAGLGGQQVARWTATRLQTTAATRY